MAASARFSGSVFAFGAVLSLIGCGGASSSAEEAPSSGGPNQNPFAATDAGAGDAADAPPPPPTPLVPAQPAGTPISAAPAQWSWVPFPDAKCMDGSPAGIGVNPGTTNKLLIVLEGGGACFDAFTCTAGTIHGSYDHPTFDVDMAAMGNSGILNRSLDVNPFKDWSYVFVPYCTGDVHAGANPSGPQGQHYVGYENIGVYLQRVVPTFASSAQVVLTGSSAGGVGAAYNFDRVQTAFGRVPVTLLDDSGPVLPDDYLKPCLQERWRTAWNLDATLPKGCTDCRLPDGGGLINMAKFLAQKYPSQAFGMISSTQDAVIRTFFSPGYSSDCSTIGYFPPSDFEAGLDALHAMGSSLDPKFHVFYPRSEMHTWLLTDAQLHQEVQGVALHDWLQGLVDGNASFRDATE